jgi:hypothetical protein
MAIIMCLANPIWASYIQLSNTSLSGVVVDHYIRVSVVQQESLLPTLAYSSNITLSWDIPAAALRNLVDKQVVVYIRVAINDDASGFYFANGTKTIYTTLECNVISDSSGETSCDQGSVLNRTIALLTNIATSETSMNDILAVEASLRPFGEFEDLANRSDALLQKISVIEAYANEVAASTSTDQDSRKLAEVNNVLSNIEGAKKLALEYSPKALDSAEEIIKDSEGRLNALTGSTQLSINLQMFAASLGIAIVIMLFVHFSNIRPSGKKMLGTLAYIIAGGSAAFSQPLLSISGYSLFPLALLVVIMFILSMFKNNDHEHVNRLDSKKTRYKR